MTTLDTMLVKLEFHEQFDCESASLEAYFCNKCNNYATHLLACLNQHMKEHHFSQEINMTDFSLNSYKCKNCLFETFSHLLLLRHKARSCWVKHKDTNLYEVNYETGGWYCNQCEYEGKKRYDLKRHMERKHTPEELVNWFFCHYCEYKTKDRKCLKSHIIRKHSSDDNWIFCTQCDFKTKTTEGLKRHLLCKHAPDESIKWIYCPHCDHRSKQLSNLKVHIRRKHTLNKGFQCEFNCDPNIPCGHSHYPQIKRFSCTLCEYKAKTNVEVKRHFHMKHAPDDSINWHTCSHCDFRSKAKHTLQRHLIFKHTPDDRIEWFACDRCDFKTKTATQLKRHQFCRHMPNECVRWMQCELCEFQCKRTVELNRHVKRIHTEARGWFNGRANSVTPKEEKKD